MLAVTIYLIIYWRIARREGSGTFGNGNGIPSIPGLVSRTVRRLKDRKQLRDAEKVAARARDGDRPGNDETVISMA